jgi:hypothetical protein
VSSKSQQMVRKIWETSLIQPPCDINPIGKLIPLESSPIFLKDFEFIYGRIVGFKIPYVSCEA